MIFLPFYHTYGVHMACFRFFASAPTSYVVVPRWDAELVLRSIPRSVAIFSHSIRARLTLGLIRFTVHVLPLIPSAIHQLVNHKLTPQIDLSSLAHIHSGAAYLPPPLANRLKKFVKAIPQVFEGQYVHRTNCLPFLTYLFRIWDVRTGNRSLVVVYLLLAHQRLDRH